MDCIRLEPEDADKFREIRLEGLKRHPEYSIASYEAEKDLPLSYFVKKLEEGYFYGFYENKEFIGIGGLYRPYREVKKQHIIQITNLYLKDEYRGKGLAKTLMAQLLQKAEKLAEQVILNVAHENEIAIALYESFGFEELGIFKKSLKLDNGEYVDDQMMIKFFDND